MRLRVIESCIKLCHQGQTAMECWTQLLEALKVPVGTDNKKSMELMSRNAYVFTWETIVAVVRTGMTNNMNGYNSS